MPDVLPLLRVRDRPPSPSRRPALRHWHRFRWAGDDPLGNAGLYACRCGEARPGI